MVSSTWLSEELTVNVAVLCMSGGCRNKTTVSYAGDAHFSKHSLEYSLNFWSQLKKNRFLSGADEKVVSQN